MQSFFSPKLHNADSLSTTSLQYFFEKLPNFENMLRELQKKGVLLNHQKNRTQVLKFFSPNEDYLKLSAVSLIKAPLPKLDCNINEPEQFIGISTQLNHKITLYIDKLCEVFNNQLAQRNYDEYAKDQENVSERTHGLQAAKITLLLGLPFDYVIAMLFHDIARATHEDRQHGNLYHHKEGQIILAPLKLSIDYVWFHPLAKQLLLEFCPVYQDLISPVSKQSLQVQKKQNQLQWQVLDKLSEHELEPFIYLIMFLRLIDDFSKVSQLQLKQEVDYFNDEIIKLMLKKQMDNVAKHKMSNEEEAQFEQSLDRALALLARSTYINATELYKSSHKMNQ